MMTRVKYFIFEIILWICISQGRDHITSKRMNLDWPFTVTNIRGQSYLTCYFFIAVMLERGHSNIRDTLGGVQQSVA